MKKITVNMKKITDVEIRWTIEYKYHLWDKPRKYMFINQLISLNKFDLIKEYFKADVVKELYTNRCNATILYNNQQIERCKKEIKELKKKIKLEQTMIKKLEAL